MQSVLITGGAGFIGQNLVHAWRAARPADRLVVVDAMTYAANVRSLEPLIADRSIVFVNGDINVPIWTAVWYPADATPKTVSGDAPTLDQKIIRTRSGQVIQLDDTQDTGSIGYNQRSGAPVRYGVDRRRDLNSDSAS